MKRIATLAALACLLTETASAQTLTASDPRVRTAIEHVAMRARLQGASPADVADLAVTYAYTDAGTGLTHVYLRQRLEGIEVAGSEVSVGLGRDGRVFHTAGTLVPGAAAQARAATRGLSADGAVVAAATHVGAPAPSLTVAAPAVGAERLTTYVTPTTALSPLTARLLYHAAAGAPVRLTWEVGPIEVADGPHAWMVRVDAQTGAEVWRADLVAHDAWGEADRAALAESAEDLGPWLFEPAAPTAAMVSSYLVYGIPLESPSHAGSTSVDMRAAVANPDNALASPFAWHDTNGVAGAEFTITQGNNVTAYTDTNNDNAVDPGSQPSGGAGLAFAPPLDLTLAPSGYRPAAVVNLFYWSNIVHDITYQYGFTEAGGNFQVNTYGRGGTGGDPVLAEAQDSADLAATGSNRNNANFATPADGGSGRMQMYLWTGGAPNRDGDFDAGIVTHEIGHGISNRLVGGPAIVTCLANADQMGEGWSDYYGLMLTMRAGDTRTTNRGVGTYPLFQATGGVGIRPAPYNTSFAVNDFTYQDTRTQAVPHGVGFVWATILWELTWDLIDAHGFDANLYNAAGPAGNQIALRLVTQGLVLTACNPGFVDGRAAILAADAALYPDIANPGQGLHYVVLWNAFARRGLGLSASQGVTTTNSDNTEAFNTPLPAPVTSVTPASVLSSVVPGGLSTATVTVANTVAAGGSDLNFTSFIEGATVPLTGPTTAAVARPAETTLPAPRGEDERAAPAPTAPPWLDPATDAVAVPAGPADPVVRGAPTGAPGAPDLAPVACLSGQQLIQGAVLFRFTVTSGTFESGQSFTAPCTGFLNTVTPAIDFTVFPFVEWGATMRVYSGAGTLGALLNSTPFAFTNGSTGSVFLNIPLSAPVPVTQGLVYTWFMDMTSASTEMHRTDTNVYADGARYSTSDGNPASATVVASQDMRFRLTFTPPVTWLSANTTGGSITAGGSNVITISFDATGLAIGTYTATLEIDSNDPATPSIDVPITLLVRAASQSIAGSAGWRMMAAPAATMTVANLASQNLVQGIPGFYPAAGTNLFTSYNGTTWVSATGGAEALGAGRGMIWYFYNLDLTPGGPSNSFALPMSIVAPAGAAEPTANVAVALHAAGSKWNLVGNPFMTGLNVATMSTWASGGTLASAVGQVWDPVSSSYLVTTAMSNTVAAWQGMMIENNTATTLTIPTGAKLDAGVFHSHEDPLVSRMVAFELEGTNAQTSTPLYDRAIVLYFHPDAIDAWDLWDASKLTPLSSAYAVLAFEGSRDGNAVLKAQESRPFDPAAAFDVPMAFEAVGTGTSFTLRWPTLVNVPDTWSFSLEDLATGATTDLRTTDHYTFTATPGAARTADTAVPNAPESALTPTTRFVMHVSPGVATGSGPGATPTVFALGAPAPNPSAAGAVLRYDVPQQADVSVEVFDLLGRRVAVLVEGPVAAGRHAARLDASSLAAGVYVVRMRAGEFVQAQRLTVVR